MEANPDLCSLEQELSLKAGELDAQRPVREQQLVALTLRRIAEGVVTKEAEIEALIGATKGQCQNMLREIVTREILHSADGLLWCEEYVERAKCDQRVNVFTGTHWQHIELQQWKDFVSLCAGRCGLPESQRMNPGFMKLLFESVAFNLSVYRRQRIPDGEVWLNMHNGTLEVKSDGCVTLREHRKEDLFTYCLGYCYDGSAGCEQWQGFLDRVLPDPQAQVLLAEFIGYCLMPGHCMEKMMLLYGEGLNGKSVTLEVVEALLGSVNVSYLSLSDLTNDDVKRAGIEGKMLNISHESGKDVNPNVLKQLTSGERVTIKNLYRDPRETNDYGKFMAAFNILPRAENSFGFFRRIIILHYQVTIPKSEIDRQLAVKLKSELSGILNWVLQSLPGLMQRREFTTCESSERALEQYRLQSDSVRLFISEMCEPYDYTTDGTELYNAYKGYCVSSSLKSIGKYKFYDRLESLGYSREKYGNVVRFKIKLSEV